MEYKKQVIGVFVCLFGCVLSICGILSVGEEFMAPLIVTGVGLTIVCISRKIFGLGEFRWKDLDCGEFEPEEKPGTVIGTFRDMVKEIRDKKKNAS